MYEINEVMAASEELGIKMKVNSENPGFHFTAWKGSIRSVSYEELEEVTLLILRENA